VSQGKAYPCFCSEDELDAIRTEQEQCKADIGYYGRWAIWRDAPIENIKAKLDEGVPFVLRFRSEGSIENKFKFNDLIKGIVEITENDKDHVIIKSDSTPVYAFAHPIDDHLMRVTHVVRGEEWLPSLPFHIQLFKALGFRLPKYLHISQLMKLEGNSKKKLSKRDHGTDMRWYNEQGYPADCLTEYVMTLLNSNYEEWRTANPNASFEDFKFSIKKMSPSGCLFDLDKLTDVSKNTIARISADEVYDGITAWAHNYDPDFAVHLTSDPDYAKQILSIGRGGAKPRKDLATWADAKPYMSLFYDDYFKVEAEYPEQFDRSDIKDTLRMFAETYNEADDTDTWFTKIKSIAEKLGYAPETKLYKKNPSDYKGHVGDISMFIRIAVTGKLNSPDLYDVMRILGAQRTINRINKQINI
jgi:glutamyl-tRNA synthetase